MKSDLINFEKDDHHCTLFVQGDVDLSNSSELRKTILSALKTSPLVEVDLADVTYIDSSGIAALVEGLQYANNHDKSFHLKRLSAHVKSIIELARLDQVFTIDD
ncbi:STAS domain-containing protein [Marinicella gelatinilytica]|uniref:STAS domain-containing protein n=1 Tax=Marinicella gelatinilytica TaxID=2996017 RepID=UPI002260ECC9|nr:STAS domain-containing protein [Marinicella gelatinilytica]MCX7544105.1 STAS domain-containing protein [Marinicella gelatinilytica]